MHRSRRSEIDVRSVETARMPTLGDVHRYAAQALHVTPRIVAAGQHVDVDVTVAGAAPGGALGETPGTAPGTTAAHARREPDSFDPQRASYRIRAIGAGDALVIQHRRHADLNPFSGLLITRASAGMPPRVLFNMGPLEEGSTQLAEACRMLDAVVQHASAR